MKNEVFGVLYSEQDEDPNIRIIPCKHHCGTMFLYKYDQWNSILPLCTVVCPGCGKTIYVNDNRISPIKYKFARFWRGLKRIKTNEKE